MQIFKLTLASCACVALLACGGGGSSTATTPDAPATASRYVGDWKVQGCEADVDVTLVAGGTAAHEQTYLKNVQSSSLTNVSGTVESHLFDNTTCAGTPRAIHRSALSFTIEGTTTVNGKVVDKAISSSAAINSGLSAGTRIVINGLSYPGDYFTRTNKDKLLLSVEGSNWFFGVPLPSGEYGTTLEPLPLAVKL